MDQGTGRGFLIKGNESYKFYAAILLPIGEQQS
jgi:hypothetical protein